MTNTSRKLTFPPSPKESSLRTIRGYAKLRGCICCGSCTVHPFNTRLLALFGLRFSQSTWCCQVQGLLGITCANAQRKNQSAHLKWLIYSFFSIPVLVSNWLPNYLGLEVRMPVLFQLRKNRHSKNQQGWFHREYFPLKNPLLASFLGPEGKGHSLRWFGLVCTSDKFLLFMQDPIIWYNQSTHSCQRKTMFIPKKCSICFVFI